MATYKKRGHKIKTKAEKVKEVAAEEMESTTAEVFNTLDESASRTEEWVAGNQKYIFIGIGAIAVILLGYLLYNNFFAKPQEAEANNEMFQATSHFQQAVNINNPETIVQSIAQRDSLFNLALNGAEGKWGHLRIIEEYPGTSAANLANYYAGISYLNLNNYEKAIEHLSAFESSEAMIGARAKGAIGDAFSQLGQGPEALEYYEKAVAHNTNNDTTPIYLMKAGITAMELQDYAKALTYFERIKNEFPAFANAPDGKMLDVYIGKAEALQ